MNAPAEGEVAREARRVLRKLLGGAHLVRCDDGRYAVVGRTQEARRARIKIEARLVEAMRARDWLGEDGGVTPAGDAWYRRTLMGEDAFADQHREMHTRRIAGDGGSRSVVRVNAMESPLDWMHQHGLVSDVQHQAGEKLRRDYTLARLAPRLAVDLGAPVVLGRRAAKPELLSDTVLAAKQRFARAMRAAGPGLSDLLFDVCCALRGLERNERARGWPRASAKVVLRIALDRLAAHYGMTRLGRARIRAWAMPEEEGA